ncbi:MAG: CBS domain-containing protein [Candidatus Moranbacteria bacterium]|nr:CBS domain-containing protein [Candidatus Moranbacteria bacterium]
MQVKEIMTKEVISANEDTTIVEISKILEKHKFHGLPIVNDNDELVGIVTESDFFIKDMPEIFLPSYITFLKRVEVAQKLPRKQRKEYEGILKAKAKDIMTKEVVSLLPESHINDLIKIFKENKIHTVPIIDNFRNLVGVVTQADVIRLLSGV